MTKIKFEIKIFVIQLYNKSKGFEIIYLMWKRISKDSRLGAQLLENEWIVCELIDFD